MFESFELSFMNVVPALLIGAVLIYVLLRRRRLTRSEREARDRGTRKLYDKE